MERTTIKIEVDYMDNDLISRSALYKAWDALDETQDANLLIDAMIKAAQDAPAVDAEPVRHGRWVLNKRFGDYECSECGHGDVTIISIRKLDMMFCPNCGAKMDAEVKE